MSKSDTNKKWVSTEDYKSNYDRVFNTPKEEDEVFYWGGREHKEEEWRDVVGYELRYQVSSFGNVRSKDFQYINYKGNERTYIGKMMKVQHTDNGYMSIRLVGETTKTLSVHRLVAKAFILNVDNLKVVHHKDNNRHNNRVDNLEWSTYSNNAKQGHLTGSMKYYGDNQSKLTEEKVLLMRQRRREGETVVTLSEFFGVGIGTVSNVCNYKTWKSVK